MNTQPVISLTKKEGHTYHSPCLTEWGLIINLTKAGSGGEVDKSAFNAVYSLDPFGPIRDPRFPPPPTAPAGF